ncbi:hypothetical protein TNCV_2047011 [Trichonephila clavipes]|uniref:Uncharacterized protein n=1 Tax=Trichonephila clavipes TaxID=2585209 RepID=A0A8X6SV04_TRICX|nr:hypothetical protein TNCV_2047011 [Trichonephila clavipes]
MRGRRRTMQLGSTSEIPIQVTNLVSPTGVLSGEILATEMFGWKHLKNDNESFDPSVWNSAPKPTLTGRNVSEIATYTAACSFNKGFLPVLKVIEVMGVTTGQIARD